ncbi:SDR family NAD(P)-dependent oxidoreductase [Pseudoclavibacter terrae]|uniref:SDR family NAD(P)-dependent oxidoreductase n=1 Tax=Pseudoclavibacter terrae TaxID=1530195 RepID=UPI001AD6E981|nr:SDR family NAD(P)-dependent oxidoreductase [Pseudoclavibacter terrae]
MLAITGGGSGVGEGLARYAASIGMAVAIADIDLVAAESVASDIRAEGGNALAVQVDVRDLSQLEGFADRVYTELGPVSLLINNAGVEQFGLLWDTPEDNWQRLIDINITGVFNGIKAFVPRMSASHEKTAIWNLSSMGGVSAAARQAPYIMSKHAVLALTECLKLDVETAGLDITVAAVLPGAVASNIFANAGGVKDGDVAAGEAERAAMLRVREQAMSPIEAARRVFEQAANGDFYLLTQPQLIGAAMNGRAEQLRTRSAPQLFSGEFHVPAE